MHYHYDLLLEFPVARLGRPPPKAHLSAGRAAKQRQDLKQRRLAGTVGTDNGGNVTGRDSQPLDVEHDDPTVTNQYVVTFTEHRDDASGPAGGTVARQY
jgi:hypothetical protein